MFIRYNLFGFSWAVLIVILSFLPGRDFPESSLTDIDKWIHAGMYGILVFFIIIGFRKQYSFCYLRYNADAVAVNTALLFGIIIEVLQALITTDRHFDITDIMANGIGCFGGWGIFKLIYFNV